MFEVVREDGGKELWFDGKSIQTSLVECALPLSILFANNKAFVSIFREGLYAWSVATETNVESVERFRRDNGITAEEVLSWNVRLQEKTLNSVQRDQWAKDVSACLNQFGKLKSTLKPGMIITPSCFEDRLHFREDDVRTALSKIEVLPPHVDFVRLNAKRLQELDRVIFIAKAAEKCSGQWSEQLYAQLKKQSETSLEGEGDRLKFLDFSAISELDRRLGLEESQPLPSEEAQAFARGEIVLTQLPAESPELGLHHFSSTTAKFHARDALSSDDFVKDAQRKASGGIRAEQAILNIALKNALQWQKDNLLEFEDAVEKLLSPDLLGDQGRERRKLIGSKEGLAAFLHVAEYVGNCGFDVLVPRFEEGKYRFLLVEVKRVTQLDGATFYLSDNERRRAVFYRVKGDPWRLWLVTSSDESLDATAQVLAPFDKYAKELEDLAKSGLRPNEWFFKLGSTSAI